MDLMLKGKKAAIVGATRGIGRAIAKELIDEGCKVSICARNQKGIDQTINELATNDTQIIGSALDASDKEAQIQWINETAEAFAGIDIFIANASALNLGNDNDAWQQNFQVDVMTTFNGVEAVIPYLKSSNAGSIVIISSIAALHTPGGPKPYGAMKAALLNYAKGLARSLAPEGIRVNSISPGNIYFSDGIWGRTEKDNPEFFKKQLLANPMGRMGTPEEVSKAAVFLASPVASFISGTNLIVDGALTLGVQY